MATAALTSQARQARGKRPRRDLPRVSESKIQTALVKLIEIAVYPDVVWTHIPSGELRDKVTAAKLQGMGVKPGWPDLLFMRPDATTLGTSVLALELKAAGGVVSADQKAVHDRLRACGVEVAVCFGLDEAIAQLKAWGIIR